MKQIQIRLSDFCGHLLFGVTMLFFCIPLSAQELSVKSMEYIPNDASAASYETQMEYDAGLFAGIVKVYVALDGVEFEGGGVLKQEKRGTGEYWVWMAKDSSRLKVRASGYLPHEVNFRTYEDVNVIHAKSAYKLVLTLPARDGGTSANKTFTVNGVMFTMVYVEGGTFTMGATSEQGKDADDDERPAHSVTLSDYYIAETEVTQELWKAVMGTTVQQQRNKVNKKYQMRGEGPNYPMYYISWEECQEFIQHLNNLTGQQFHLPTEAQWEYAARGGNKGHGYKYSGGNNIEDVAWYDDNLGNGTHLVKTKSPNELGIYDMSGNVYEWCQDRYGSYSSSPQTNPTGASSGSDRVFRGGSWWAVTHFSRVSARRHEILSFRYDGLGLRLAL